MTRSGNDEDRMDGGAGDASRIDAKAALRADLEALRMDRSAAASLPPGRGRRKSRRSLLGTASVVALALIAWLLLAGRPRPVSLLRVTAGDAAALASVPVLSAAGYVVPGEKIAEIGSRVPGRVARFLVEEGDHVEAGQPLVELDARPFAHALEQAERRIASARARLSLARREVARSWSLVKQGYLSPEELDKRESEEWSAAAELAEADAGFAAAKLDLEDTLLRAPTSGIVLAKLKEAGEVAVPGGFAGSGDLVRFANMEDVRAEVDVNESDLARIWIGQRAEVTPDALPRTRFAAAVVKLDPEVDRQKGTLKIEVKLAESDRRLLPDMRARVSFFADPNDAALQGPVVALPSAAVRRGVDGRTYVWVVTDGRARRRFIETAGLVGEDVHVVEGLVGGEDVVVGDPPEKDGQRVAPAVR